MISSSPQAECECKRHPQQILVRVWSSQMKNVEMVLDEIRPYLMAGAAPLTIPANSSYN